MLFNSYEFILLFLPVTFFGFFGTFKFFGQKAAVFFIVAASFVFYGAWDFRYVPLLFFSIVFNFFAGKFIAAAKEKGNRGKKELVCGIAGNLLLLGFFKYTAFFAETINQVGGEILTVPQIILPLGISFFTFTQTAYLIDVYRGETQPTDFLVYCEFVTIFPHLIAGPIISYREMMPQFADIKNYVPNAKNIALGLTLFIMGLFKKVIIADSIAPWANAVFSNAHGASFADGWIGSVAYTLELYFDFSGYSEMAIGLGLLFNLKFPVNFDSPYQSKSIIDFWRRWHMSLSSWVREYLYIPMGGNRHGEFAKMRNLFLCMTIIGFWHGAGWTFILWGALNGVYLIINNLWRKLKIDLPIFFCVLLTFLSFNFSLMIFRSENISDAFALTKALFNADNIFLPTDGAFKISVLLLLLILLYFCPNPVRITEKLNPARKSVALLWATAAAVMFAVSLLFLNRATEFLYFQF